MEKNSLGLVEVKCFEFAQGDEALTLESGVKFGPITVAYETYGELNDAKNNAILICHALSGDAHAAGFYDSDEKPGWWDAMIGPGKAFDTDKYFIICSNSLGGCQGTTGPSSINQKTGNQYALDFPIFTIADMVSVQRKLIEHFGIEKLLAVAGGSMGGMQSLQWAALYPEWTKSVIPIATTWKHSPQQIAFDEVGRQAVMADPVWNKGDYYAVGQPGRGLAVARMIGHITYMSDASMEDKFSRKLIKNSQYSFTFKGDFEVEGYLRYRGDSFVKRFDANSYLYLTKAMDYFDLSDGKLISDGKKKIPRFLLIAFESDWLYPAYQTEQIVHFLKSRNVDTTYCKIQSQYGHDAFLLEIEEQSRLIRPFLAATYNRRTS